MSRVISVPLIRAQLIPLPTRVEHTILMLLMFSRLAVHPAGTCYASGGEDGFVRVHHFDDSYFKAKPYGDLDIAD